MASLSYSLVVSALSNLLGAVTMSQATDTSADMSTDSMGATSRQDQNSTVQAVTISCILAVSNQQSFSLRPRQLKYMLATFWPFEK